MIQWNLFLYMYNKLFMMSLGSKWRFTEVIFIFLAFWKLLYGWLLFEQTGFCPILLFEQTAVRLLLHHCLCYLHSWLFEQTAVRLCWLFGQTAVFLFLLCRLFDQTTVFFYWLFDQIAVCLLSVAYCFCLFRLLLASFTFFTCVSAKIIV